MLGEHFSAGRLTVDEYGDRSAKVTTARTAGDLEELFTDLPAPHPVLAGPAPEPASQPQPATTQAAPVQRTADRGTGVDRPDLRPPAQRFAGAMIGVSWIVAIALMAVTHVGQLIFLPIALSIVFGSFWGRGWNRGGDYRRRDRR